MSLADLDEGRATANGAVAAVDVGFPQSNGYVKAAFAPGSMGGSGRVPASPPAPFAEVQDGIESRSVARRAAAQEAALRVMAEAAARSANTPDPAACRLVVVAPNGARDHAAAAEAIASRGYSVEWTPRLCKDGLVQMFAAQHVNVFVLQVEHLNFAELNDMLRLRLRFPAVRWILACHLHSPRWAELVVRFRARGFIDLEDPRTIGRAIDAVVAGDLWFPRWLSQALYIRLLSTVRSLRLDVAHNVDCASRALTLRETAALELMRQGLTNKEIARRLAISVDTVKKHLKAAFDKRGLHSRRQGIECAAGPASAAALSDSPPRARP